MKKILITILTILFIFNCSITKKAKKFNNTSTPTGKPVYYQTTKNIAVYFFFGLVPIHKKLGSSGFENTLDDFTKSAAKDKNTKVHIIHREDENYWYAGFPFTVIFTPISTELTGYVQE
ncbi:MAG: hypothetical protein KDK36_09250 [Leptospiraceae bacterium]|nr:hypothetical protein [Leptospiraceae bacterium]